jgi:hypothetical protein
MMLTGLLYAMFLLLNPAAAKCPYKLKLQTVTPVPAGNATEYCLGVSRSKNNWCGSSTGQWNFVMKTKQRCKNAVQAVSLDGQTVHNSDVRPAPTGNKFDLFIPNVRSTSRVCLTLEKPCDSLKSFCGGNKNCKYAIREASAGMCAYEKCSL